MSYCLLLSILPSEQIWYVTGILLFLSVRRIVTDDFEVDANPMMIVAGEDQSCDKSKHKATWHI